MTHGRDAPGEDHDLQHDLIPAMMKPDFYPRTSGVVTHQETRSSHLFFTGDIVYKVKKAVRYSFLDFSTALKRRRFLSEELRLNRRLAPSVYLAVVPIIRTSSGWSLSAEGETAEYALVMRRLPEKRMLPFLIETRQVTPAMMRDLAEVVARFHAAATPVTVNEPERHPLLLEKLWRINLAELQRHVGELPDRDFMAVIDGFGTNFLRRHRDLLTRRAQEGWIRDIHGDLHCEHVCFAPEGIQIFDCVEFSSRLRCGDIVSELGFLLMDLDVRGGRALLQPFLDRYREIIKDPDLTTLLPFYQCYRALMRGRVRALRNGGGSDALSYFRSAARFTWKPLQPFVVLLCGLTGSGKTTLARELSARIDLPVFSSDVIRRTLTSSAAQAAPSSSGIYRQEMTDKIYRKIVRDVEKEILAGRGAILDATFARRVNREKVGRMAAKHNTPVFLIHCFATEATIKSRLAESAPPEQDFPTDRWKMYVDQKARCEPPSEIAVHDYLELNTVQPVEELAAVCERFLRSRLGRARVP